MLISFSVENFRSIRDLQTLSMEARADDHLEESNVFTVGKRRLLKSAALYGPNASGKSNVLQAMRAFWDFSLGWDLPLPFPTNEVSAASQPFRLSTESEKVPSHFEAEFIWEGTEYRYGFEAKDSRVESEWFFRKLPGKKAARLFKRERQAIELSSPAFKEGKGLEARTREDVLFLTVCAHFNGKIARGIMEWMQRFRSVLHVTNSGFVFSVADYLENEKQRERLLALTQRADFGIRSLRAQKDEGLPQLFVNGGVSIKTTHTKHDADGRAVGLVEFDLVRDESDGTQKFVSLSHPVSRALEEGSVLIVDELDARLHPQLTQALVDLFHSPVNHKNAQLIFAAHDVTLMEPERFRRDQIWFCEKDETGATDLYSLADFDANQVRPTTKFSRQYLQGLFGAVPKLAHFQEAVADATTQE